MKKRLRWKLLVNQNRVDLETNGSILHIIGDGDRASSVKSIFKSFGFMCSIQGKWEISV